MATLPSVTKVRLLVVAAAGVALVAFLASGAVATAGSKATVSATSKTLVVTTRKVPKLGTILVSSTGRTLYMFVPDKDRKVTCVSTCAVIWPPLYLSEGAKLEAKGGVEQKLLASDPDPAGGRVVTYDKWPLYYYISDTKPGMATGQALNLNGGLWYVMAPSGKIIKTTP